jgi:hypothetical protein
MSDNLACARTRESAEWLASYVGKQDPDTMRFSKDELLGAFDTGLHHASAVHRAEQDEWCIERATGQRQLDEALCLIAEAAALFTGYADHHKARAAEPGEPEVQAASLRKAALNLSMALSLREYMAAAEPTLPLDEAVEVLQRARAGSMPNVLSFPERFANRAGYGNVRPVTSGPLADPAVVAGLAAVVEPGEVATPLSTIRAHAFQLHTADPRFDPSQPVLINGYAFTPATESNNGTATSAD